MGILFKAFRLYDFARRYAPSGWSDPDALAEYMEKGDIYVMERNSRVVGFAVVSEMEPGVAYCPMIVIMPRYRGKHGRMIMADSLEGFKAAFPHIHTIKGRVEKNGIQRERVFAIRGVTNGC